jgi:D-alanine-D-alanine ligase
MKVAIAYNRESEKVINLFGVPNREKLGMATISRLANALREGGHQVQAFEGDKDLISRLEEFMPRVLKGERPGLVFNVSYGIQGQARYTHVPSILEMVGIPYVGSGPLAHTLALDKVVAKMLFRQHGLPTPEFAVIEDPDAPIPELPYPLIVKPRNEAVSFGLRVVENDTDLREAARVIFDRFRQPVLVERYVEGPEINVGIIGNEPAETFEPVLLRFPSNGPAVYTYEDKTGKSGRQIEVVCPAPIDDDIRKHSRSLAVRAFRSLGCADCARVDMRLDGEGNLFLLEINSLPSLGQRGSYVAAAAQAGLDFTGLVNRLVEVASARYFGTPKPPKFTGREVDPESQIFGFLTQRRDRMETRLGEWVRRSSRTSDALGLRERARELGRLLGDMGLVRDESLTEPPFFHLWSTKKGLDGGVLLVAHLDVPMAREVPGAGFRREPEQLLGEGVAVSRAPLVALEFALRSVRNLRRLSRFPLGVVAYADEGDECHYSADRIRRAMSRAGKVLVLRPGSSPDRLVTQRRGQRRYRLAVEGRPPRPGGSQKRPEPLRWAAAKLEELAQLSSRKDHLSVSTVNLRTHNFPMLLPHEVTAVLLVTYLRSEAADQTEAAMRRILGKGDVRWSLERIADRPPMKERRRNVALARDLEEVARHWEIPLSHQSSVWPSVAGLVPTAVPVVCGLGPVGENLGTPQEAVHRISLVQRTLLLAQYLAQESRR